MSVHFASELLTTGWSVNGQWLILSHDEDGQVWLVQVHSSAGWLWSHTLPYTDPLDCISSRAAALGVGARWSLVDSGALCAERTYTPTHCIMARLSERATPLVGVRTCLARRGPFSVCMAGRPVEASCEAPWGAEA